VPRIIGITHSKTDTTAALSSTRTAGTSAAELTEKSRSILAAAMQMDASISPESLGYLLVDVQTRGFTEPLSKFQQGTPFLRGSLIVLDFSTSGGGEHTQINLIERFLQPKATALFSTDESEVLRKKMVKAYAKVADMVEARSKGMRGGEMVNSESVKTLMDPVMAPLIQFICGPDLKFATSTMPDFWKRLLSSIDNSIIQWTSKLGNCTPQEVVQLRKEALVAFISTRGIMVAWGMPNINDLAKLKIDSKKFSTYLNSYFAHRAERFLADIMLTRKDKAGDKAEQQMRNYLETLHGIKELKARPGEEIIPGRRTLMKSKTLRVTLRDSHEFEDNDSPLSPRLRERIALEKARDEKEDHNWMMRKKFFRDLAKKAGIAQADPEFYRYAEERVRKASEHGFAVISRDPLKFLEKSVTKFYGMPENLKQKREGIDQQLLKAIHQLQAASPSVPAPASFAFKPFPTEDDISDDAVSTVTTSSNSPTTTTTSAGARTTTTSANSRTTTTTTTAATTLLTAPKQAANSSDSDQDSESTTD